MDFQFFTKSGFIEHCLCLGQIDIILLALYREQLLPSIVEWEMTYGTLDKGISTFEKISHGWGRDKAHCATSTQDKDAGYTDHPMLPVASTSKGGRQLTL